MSVHTLDMHTYRYARAPSKGQCKMLLPGKYDDNHTGRFGESSLKPETKTDRYSPKKQHRTF